MTFKEKQIKSIKIKSNHQQTYFITDTDEYKSM